MRLRYFQCGIRSQGVGSRPPGSGSYPRRSSRDSPCCIGSLGPASTRFAVVAVCAVVAVEIVGRFQGHRYAPDPPGSVAYPEGHIARTELRQVIQLTAGVGLASKDQGGYHAGVTAAAVGALVR